MDTDFYSALEMKLSLNSTYFNQSKRTLDAFNKLKEALNEDQQRLLYEFEEEVSHQEFYLCEIIAEYIKEHKA